MPWTSDLRCLECGAEYSASPRDVFVGPLFEEVVIGRETQDGIDLMRTKQLYTGAVTHIDCPSCLLRIRIASDLAPHSLRRYLEYQAKDFADLEMDRIFEPHRAVALIRPFPIECPRCAWPIKCAKQPKACRECGATQLQTIRSAST